VKNRFQSLLALIHKFVNLVPPYASVVPRDGVPLSSSDDLTKLASAGSGSIPASAVWGRH
jgi:hypothetical protein